MINKALQIILVVLLFNTSLFAAVSVTIQAPADTRTIYGKNDSLVYPWILFTVSGDTVNNARFYIVKSGTGMVYDESLTEVPANTPDAAIRSKTSPMPATNEQVRHRVQVGLGPGTYTLQVFVQTQIANDGSGWNASATITFNVAAPAAEVAGGALGNQIDKDKFLEVRSHIETLRASRGLPADPGTLWASDDADGGIAADARIRAQHINGMRAKLNEYYNPSSGMKLTHTTANPSGTNPDYIIDPSGVVANTTQIRAEHINAIIRKLIAPGN